MADQRPFIIRIIYFAIAFFLMSIGLLLPYSLRKRYIHFLAFWVHLPFVLFGMIAGYILKSLGYNSNES